MVFQFLPYRWFTTCTLRWDSQGLEILDIASIDIILSEQWTTKALIRLRRCTGWSAPLLFACGKNRFSHDVAHIIPTLANWPDAKWTMLRPSLKSRTKIIFCSFHTGIYSNEYSQLATCICLSWIFTIFDWSMYILTDRWRQVSYPCENFRNISWIVLAVFLKNWSRTVQDWF